MSQTDGLCCFGKLSQKKQENYFIIIDPLIVWPDLWKDQTKPNISKSDTKQCSAFCRCIKCWGPGECRYQNFKQCFWQEKSVVRGPGCTRPSHWAVSSRKLQATIQWEVRDRWRSTCESTRVSGQGRSHELCSNHNTTVTTCHYKGASWIIETPGNQRAYLLVL